MARFGGPFLFHHMWFPYEWFPYDSPSSCIVDNVIERGLWLTDSIIKFDLQSLDCIIKRGLKGETVFLNPESKRRLYYQIWPSRVRPYYEKMPSDLRQCDQRGGQGLDCVINLVLWWVDNTIKGGPEGKTVLLKRPLEPKTVFYKARSRARLCLCFWPSNQRPYYRKVPSI
jgi:hypothetical protein